MDEHERLQEEFAYILEQNTRLQEELDQVRSERVFYLKLLELGAQTEFQPLLQQALELIVDVTHARKGYLELFTGEERDAPHWWIAHDCSDADVQTIRSRISTGIITQAIAKGETIETASAMHDERFSQQDSVQANQIEAVLCTPVGHQPCLGVVYLQGRNAPGPFARVDRDRAQLFALRLAPLVDRLRVQHLRRHETDKTAEIRRHFECSRILGRSAALADVLKVASSVAPLEIDVLLTGPSGSGKTAMARAIVQNSPRARGPFVELNCASIPESLLESELFGAEKGAHSTATSRRPGKVEAAEGGTLFLDEVGELPLPAQAKLLQLLQSREYYPLGSTRAKRADIRLISATNSDLAQMVKEKLFREDLYHRIKILPIRLPPLTERREDIGLLLDYYCREYCDKHNVPQLCVTRSARLACEENEWPGNIRELSHAVEAAVVRARADGSRSLEVQHLFPENQNLGAPHTRLSYREATRNFQRRFLLEALERNHWNVADAARELDVARSHLYNLINTHDLEPEA